MTHGTPTIGHEHTLLPNQPFFSWLRTQTTLFISQILALLGFISFLASMIYYVSDVWGLGTEKTLFKTDYVNIVTDFAHILFIVIFIIALIQVLDDNVRGSYRVSLVYERVFKKKPLPAFQHEILLERSKNRLRWFKILFLWFWCVMLALYIAFAFEHSLALVTAKSEAGAAKELHAAAHSADEQPDSAHEKETPDAGDDSVAVSGTVKIAKVATSPSPKGETIHPEKGGTAPRSAEDLPLQATPSSKENQTAAVADLNISGKLEISRIPHESAKAKNTADQDSSGNVAKDRAFPFITFALNNVSLMFVFWCFLLLYLPAHRPEDLEEPKHAKPHSAEGLASKTNRNLSWSIRTWKPFILSLFIILILTGAYELFLGRIDTPGKLTAHDAAFDAVSGTLNALVLALLIARLDSKLVGLPSWLIFVLYSYSAVQPLFVVFEQPSPELRAIRTAVLIVVFISKLYFFLIIFYTLQTGRMLNYFYCFPFLSRRVMESEGVLALGTGAADEHVGIPSPRTRTDPDQDGNTLRSIEKLKATFRKVNGIVCTTLKDQRILTISKILGISGLVSFCGFLIWHGAGQGTGLALDFGSLVPLASQINVFVVVVIILTLWGMLNDNHHGSGRVPEMYRKLFGKTLSEKEQPEAGEEQVRKFKRYFLWFWILLLLLYFTRFIPPYGVPIGTDVASTRPLPDTWSVIKQVFKQFLDFLLNTGNLLCVFWCFVVLYSPAYDERSERKQKLLVRYSFFVIALLNAAFPLLLFSLGPNGLTPKTLGYYGTVFQGISGTLGAIALALLIARLDSKILSLSSWLICVLFAYSAVQALSVVFGLERFQGIEAAALIAGLIFKVCFFLIVAYALQSGKILNYLICFPFLDKRVDSIFENQFEIRTSKDESNSFTFGIWKSNKLVYSTEDTYKSRRDCDHSIEQLRELMQDEKHYHPDRSCGTHWVEVTDSHKRLLCESISLRSKEEADHLIHESIDKIPYCKYERS